MWQVWTFSDIFHCYPVEFFHSRLKGESVTCGGGEKIYFRSKILERPSIGEY